MLDLDPLSHQRHWYLMSSYFALAIVPFTSLAVHSFRFLDALWSGSASYLNPWRSLTLASLQAECFKKSQGQTHAFYSQFSQSLPVFC